MTDMSAGLNIEDEDHQDLLCLKNYSTVIRLIEDAPFLGLR